MPQELNLYIDDSGTRHPNRNPKLPSHGYDWFSLGGIVIDAEREGEARAAHATFCENWKIITPLHSAEIRNRTDNFTWLGKLGLAEHRRFMDDLYGVMQRAPVLGTACVIDRPGYRARYVPKYGRQQWSLCKTAFSVLTERAAKLAKERGRKLNVYFERGDKSSDGWMLNYFSELRHDGLPFNAANMEKYKPLSSAELRQILYDCKSKMKSSPMIQLADLYLWPISIGGYHRSNRTYARLMEDKKLIDCHLAKEDIEALGIKYSCWENVAVKP
jgi:hypothetical protein